MKTFCRYCILLAIFSSVCEVAVGQTYSLSDTTLANKLADSASIDLAAGENQSKLANSNILKSIEIYEALYGRDYKKLAGLYFIKSNTLAFSEFKEKEECIENCLRITKLNYGENHKSLRKYINTKGYILGCKAAYKIALDYLKQYTGLLKNESESDFDEYENTIQSIAIYHQTIKEPDSAIYYFNKALDILKRSTNGKKFKPGLEKILKNSIANCYLQKGDFLKYDSLFVRVETMMSPDLFEHLAPNDTSRLLEKYLFLADKSIDNEDYSMAMVFLKNYLEILNAYKPSLKKAMAKELINLGDVCLKVESYGEAYENYEKAANIISTELTNDKIFFAESLEKMAGCKLKHQEYNHAIALLTQASKAKREIDSTGIELVKTYLKLAQAFQLNRDFDLAEKYYQQSLEISKSKKNQEWLNKTLSDYAQFLVRQNRYDEALSAVSQSFELCNVLGSGPAERIPFLPVAIQNLDLFAKIQDVGKFIHADSIVHLYDKMFELADLERKRNYLNSGIISQAINYKPAFEHAITYLLRTDTDHTNAEYIEKAFAYCERNKFIKLQEGLNKTKALKFSGIPDSIVSKEKHYTESIARVHKLLYESENKTSTLNSEYLTNLMISEGRLNYQSKAFNKQMEIQHPKYFMLKNSIGKVDLNEIRTNMHDDDSALLSYFVGDSCIVIFLVQPDTIIFRQIQNDFNLNSLVKSMLASATGFHVNPEMVMRFDSLSLVYTNSSSTLFEKLVQPLYPFLPRHLTIIPDEVLGYLPFEALLVEKPEVTTRFNRFHYFLNDHIISYAYSASAWLEMRDKTKQDTFTRPITAFAPFYNGESVNLEQVMAYRNVIRKKLNPLPFSGEEAFKISRLFNGSYYLGNSGTKQNFLEQSKNSRILHIATHAQANDKLGDYCFLVFSGDADSTNNEVLYANDIYNLDLKSELVTLSACETGLGQLKGGEGIISLSRAFTFAGARSLVTSLWQVSDSKTKDLMISFYRNLHDGMRKDEALWKAKKDYLLNNKGEAASPYYWAGFIGVGNMSPIRY